jgi:acetyl-CoA carboxylase biotin carboxylase subunit
MNTRLQVEHPITELTTGFDLVREQVRIAAGEPLGYGQADISRRGHAIECRVYAEDPATGFLPSPGRIEVLRVPSGPGVRDDSGTYQGAEVSMSYDPLISKLCVWAPTRPLAVDRMRRALGEYVVGGIRTNLPFHLAVMDDVDFIRGDYDTGFIAARKEALTQRTAKADDIGPLAAGAAIGRAIADRATSSRTTSDPKSSDGPSPWRIGTLARL